MIRLFSIAGGLVTALFLSSVALAGGHMAGDGAPTETLDRMTRQLKLTDPQKQEMAALLEIYAPRFKELKQRGDEARQQLMQMAPDDPGYAELTKTVSEEAGRTASEVVVLLAEMQSSAYALLTPEQQERYLKMRETRQARFKAMRERYREGGGARKGGHGYGHGGHGKGHSHGEDHVCEHGEDGVCPHHPDGKKSDAKPGNAAKDK